MEVEKIRIPEDDEDIAVYREAVEARWNELVKSEFDSTDYFELKPAMTINDRLITITIELTITDSVDFVGAEPRGHDYQQCYWGADESTVDIRCPITLDHEDFRIFREWELKLESLQDEIAYVVQNLYSERRKAKANSEKEGG